RVDARCDSIMVASVWRTPVLGAPPLGRSIIASWPMYYVSSTTKQNISPVPLGDVNQQVIGVEIVTSGAITPLSATSFTLNTAGTGGTVPNQIQNAKLFFTSTTPTFSTATQVGSTVAAPNGAFTITPSATLFNGTNYFWLSYDVLSTATCALNIDAQCNSLTVGGTPYTPTVTSPLGGRNINCGIPYYSVASLVMNNLSSWNTMRNGSGSPPPAGAFTVTTNDFYVQNGHSMTTNAAMTLLNLYVEGGGRVTASNLVTMTNFRIYGGGTFEQTVAATNATYITNFWIDNGGTWIHNNNGYLPGVNRYFTANSTQWFKKVGGGTFPSNTAWGNVIMDVSTNGNFYINGNSISTIQGNWEWRKTGTNNWWAVHPTNSPTNIGGDLIISGGKLYGAFNNISSQPANIVINVAGNYKLIGGTFEDYISPYGNPSTSSCILNISSNVDISGGVMHFNRTTGGLTQINITGGLLSATWKQRGGTVTLGNTYIKNSPAGKILTLIGTSMNTIPTGRTILLETGATLMTGNYPVQGAGTFTMQDNSTLGLGRINGLTAVTGNITTTTRNFHSGGNYIFYEDKTPQVMGVFTTTPTANRVRNLEIRKDSAQYRVDMSQNLSVAEVTKLTLGELNLNSFMLTALSPGVGAIDRNGSTTLGYIKSETNAAVNPSIVQWNLGATNGTYVIPFGVSSTGFIPLTFEKTAGSSNLRFSTRATATSANTPWAGASSVAAVANMNRGTADSSITSVIDRWWDITAMTGISSVTANIIFTYRGSENTLPDGITPAGWPNYRTGALSAQHWNGSTWDAPVGSGTGVASGTGNVTVTGANTFSPWILVAQPAPLFDTPLPIVLLTFDATVVTEGVNLTWTTSSEINNNFFTVERSADAEHFEFVTQVDGAGNSSQTRNYSVVDGNPLRGISYYRLRQTDFDGKSTTSGIVAVNISDGAIISFIPNPAQDFINIIFSNAAAKGDNVIEILDSKGKSVMKQTKYMSHENNVYRIDLSHYSSGMYVVKVTDSTGKVSAKRFIRR
ncbi:MAG TPA: T9SS type A sorting domain-containing protein, partial [Bacteroidia bacterium]|nr:T9SS type A sorting domain-containing protein [Bacteroidia bacterium]